MKRAVSSLALGALAALAISPSALAVEESPPQSRCDVSQWQMTWGVKESFRAYLSGSIAQGEWMTAGDVSYATPVFTVRGSNGWLAADGTSGELSAEGEIRFVGHGGILDQTLSHPQLAIEEDLLTVVFDVSGDTQEGVSVEEEAVPFVRASVSPSIDSQAGEWSVDGVETSLTAEGARAFGTYPEGEPFDPVSLRIELEPNCLAQPSGVPAAIGWVAGISVAVSALALAVTAWVRKSRGRGRPAPQES